MGLKRRLFSIMFFRNMLADFGARSAYSEKPGDFIPYFEYKIGVYQPDYYLYFPKEPYTIRYHNEIFNKIAEYKGYDIIRFLEFHYSAYLNKQDFLRFLQFELAAQLNMKVRGTVRPKLQSALEWVQEQQQALHIEEQAKLKHEIEQEVRSIVNNDQLSNGEIGEKIIEDMSGKLSDLFDKIWKDAQEKNTEIANKSASGQIELGHRSHEKKIMQLFYILQSLQPPASEAKAEKIFKKLSTVDIALILQHYFDAFKELKLNTLQKNIGAASNEIDHNDPIVKQLNDALQDFFYK